MKRLFVSLVLLLAACSAAPRQLVPRIDDTGPCAGSEIQLKQALLYSDDNNRWSLIALATNMRVDNYEIVMVCITVNQKDGSQASEQQLIGASLRSYETLPFRLLLQGGLDQAERVTVAAQPFPNPPTNGLPASAPARRRNFVYTISQMRSELHAPMIIAGRLRNNEPQPMINVRVIIGLYDRNGLLVGVANGMAAEVAPIAPGSVAPFTATTNMLLAPIAATSVVIEGEPAK
jgi:hypothetical protein